MSPENQPGVVTDVAIGVATQSNKDKYDRIVTKDEYDMIMLCYVHLSFSQHFLLPSSSSSLEKSNWRIE